MQQLVERAQQVAVKLAQQAGQRLMEALAGGIEMELKGEIDPVTALDRETERFLVENIGREFPDHDFLAEEETNSGDGGGFRWVIDPIDGTTNFAHGYPCFAISLGLEHEGRAVLGVIHQPATRETFTATAGGGTFLGERQLQVGGAKRLDRAFLVTGFPYNIRETGVLERNVRLFSRFLGGSFAVRRDGSAAYDLACVAAGRFDGFWEENLKHWDTAAGVLMVREAGGIVTDFSGRQYEPSAHRQLVAAGNPVLHEQMLDIIRQENRA